MTAGLAIYDTMQYIKPQVSTVCLGQAASMGSLLLAAGAPGKRFALPHSRVMMHQPSGGATGQAADIEIHAREILKIRQRLNEVYQRHTGLPIEDIEKLVGAGPLHGCRGGEESRHRRFGGGAAAGRRLIRGAGTATCGPVAAQGPAHRVSAPSSLN